MCPKHWPLSPISLSGASSETANSPLAFRNGALKPRHLWKNSQISYSLPRSTDNRRIGLFYCFFAFLNFDENIPSELNRDVAEIRSTLPTNRPQTASTYMASERPPVQTSFVILIKTFQSKKKKKKPDFPEQTFRQRRRRFWIALAERWPL